VTSSLFVCVVDAGRRDVILPPSTSGFASGSAASKLDSRIRIRALNGGRFRRIRPESMSGFDRSNTPLDRPTGEQHRTGERGRRAESVIYLRSFGELWRSATEVSVYRMTRQGQHGFDTATITTWAESRFGDSVASRSVWIRGRGRA